jgi:2-(3-amino-3-carboxypropyl)histidine synthase
MKTIFIEAKYSGEIDLSKIKLEELPEKICLVTTVQFVDYLSDIKKYLEKKGKNIFIGKGKQVYSGQILGCEQSSALELNEKADAYLYIGDGYFHPIGIALKTKKDVFIFNPLSNEFKRLEKEEIEKIEKKRIGMLNRFYNSKEIGVIVSIKPGQNNLKKAKELKKKFPDKNFYFILFDNVEHSGLENFNFIECWVNTACPRIEEDIKVLNIDDLN